MTAGVKQVTLADKIAGEDIPNDVSKVEVNRSTFKQINASDSVVNGPGRIFGIFVSSSSSGTFAVYDGSTTSDTLMINTTAASAGQYYQFGALEFGEGLHVALGGTIECTVLYKKEIA